ncbi:MAG: nucleotidyltransferase family protein [Candidatus Cloacimonetes bacterium]|nr:nucleotidyltransferase family protein [Candidatus Cloacimonadota bacterium]
MNRDEILKYLRQHKEELLQFGVEEIGLFGSYAKGNNTVNSDVDILVKFGNTNSKFYSYFNLKNYLQDRLHLEIDLCREEDIRKEFREDILRGVIYA